MEGANSYSNPNPNPNPNPKPIQPPSNYHANHYDLPLFRSTMAKPMNTFIYRPSPRITVFSVPADATVIIKRGIKQHHHHHLMSTTPNVNLGVIPRVPSRVPLPSTLRQASLPLSGLRSPFSGHCNYNNGTARRSKIHAHIDLNKAPCDDTNFDDDGDDDQVIKSFTRRTNNYKCHVCMAEFSSPQAYGGHMSFHSKQNRDTYEEGESSRPCKKAKKNPN